MSRRDRAVIAALVLALGALAVAIGIQALPPAPVAATPSPSIPIARPYVEGVVGRASSISPLSARGEVERELVALVFGGLLRNGPGGTLVGDLADHWSLEEDGTAATFRIRADATWHDGTPVTADDVAFTIATLQDPEFTGPGGASWREVTVRVTDERTIRFELATPLGGFLQAATQPIVPAHLLGDVAVADRAAAAFGQAPVGTGHFRVVSLDEREAVLVPAVAPDPEVTPSPDASATLPPDFVEGSPSPTAPPRPIPYLAGMVFRFFDSSADLAAAYEGGDLDAASGLSLDDAARLGAAPGSRLLRYPTTTLTAIVVNLRAGQTLFTDAAARRGLLAGIDRASILADDLHGFGVVADAPIPPSSWAFDAASSTPIAYDPAAVAPGLETGGWTLVDGTWRPPNSEGEFIVELLYPASATGSVAEAVAEAVAADWTAAGVSTNAVPLPPAEFAASRIREGDFDAAVVSVNIGLDPDLYPLLASTQATRGGSNISGVQDRVLDDLLEKARAPGTDEERTAAYAALQVHLAERQYLLPIVFREIVVVVRDALTGPEVRTLGDPGGRFWDVLTWRLANDR